MTDSVLYESSEAASVSKNILQFRCVCNMEAGHVFVTFPSRAFLTASAFRLSGTETIKHALFMICRMLIDIARRGTCSNVSNHPSPNCWALHFSSRLTMIYGSSVSKSAGGSLNARWPFSPIPIRAASIGCFLMMSPNLRHSCCGFSASPSTKCTAFRAGTCVEYIFLGLIKPPLLSLHELPHTLP